MAMVARGVDAERSGETQKARGHGIGQPVFAALCDENAIGRFGEHAGVAAERR
jgi:hypothetical protein